MVKRYDVYGCQFVKYEYYAATKAELDALREQFRWRDLKSEEPEYGQHCLVLEEGSDDMLHVTTAHWNGERDGFLGLNRLRIKKQFVKGWMPTPPTTSTDK